jgi:hypothetical protein
MKASTKKFLLTFGYCACLAWIVPALTFMAYQVKEQHEIFRLLRTIRYGHDQAAVDKAEVHLGDFGLEGLIYIIQELKQDEERDKRIKLANVLERFLTGDSDRSRWGWGEKKALCRILDTWPETPGREMVKLDDDEIKRILTTKSSGTITPQERRHILRFAIEYALVALRWRIDDAPSVDRFRSKAQRLRFSAFLDLVRAEQIKMRFAVTDRKPEVELSGDDNEWYKLVNSYGTCVWSHDTREASFAKGPVTNTAVAGIARVA